MTPERLRNEEYRLWAEGLVMEGLVSHNDDRRIPAPELRKDNEPLDVIFDADIKVILRDGQGIGNKHSHESRTLEQ